MNQDKLTQDMKKEFGIVTETKVCRRYFVADQVLVNGGWVKADPEVSIKTGDVVEILSYNGRKSAQLVPDHIWYPINKGICY